MCVWCGVRVCIYIYMKKCTPSCLVKKSINFRILDFSSVLAFFEYFNY
jgi:hypothetical protein